MKYVDRTKLKAKMIERGYTVLSLSHAMGITRTSLYNKLNGRDFSEEQISYLKSIFGNHIFLK